MVTTLPQSYKCSSIQALKMNFLLFIVSEDVCYRVWALPQLFLEQCYPPQEDYNLQDKHHPPANTDRNSKISYHLFPPYGRQSTCDHFHFRMLLPPPVLSSASLNVHHSQASLLIFCPPKRVGWPCPKIFLWRYDPKLSRT